MSLLLSILLGSSPASAGPVWMLVLPFGAPQFSHDEPVKGGIYLGTQLAMGGLATWSTIEMWGAAVDGRVDEELVWRLVSAGAVAGFTASWTFSAIGGSRLHQFEDLPEEERFSATWRLPSRQVPWAPTEKLSEALEHPVLGSYDPLVSTVSRGGL